MNELAVMYFSFIIMTCQLPVLFSVQIAGIKKRRAHTWASCYEKKWLLKNKGGFMRDKILESLDAPSS